MQKRGWCLLLFELFPFQPQPFLMENVMSRLDELIGMRNVWIGLENVIERSHTRLRSGSCAMEDCGFDIPK